MLDQTKKRLPFIFIALVAAILLVVWLNRNGADTDPNLVSGNGRIEATEIDIAAKTPGRLKNILVHEGEFISAGQTLAEMDAEVLMAQHRQAQAQLQQMQSAVNAAANLIKQRQNDHAAAKAVAAQQRIELKTTQSHLARSEVLAEKGFITAQIVEDERANVARAQAALNAAQAQVAVTLSAIESARAQLAGAESSVAAAQANIERIQADINDLVLRSPRDGRVQFIVAQPGEVVGAGGRIMNIVDLHDVYMTFFLPTAVAGRLAIGSDVRIILDAAPAYIVPANISFISDVAQFTPKTVETAVEREKLMFRVRAQIPPDLLEKYLHQVKTGLPGVAYVRVDEDQPWPEHLQEKLPQ